MDEHLSRFSPIPSLQVSVAGTFARPGTGDRLSRHDEPGVVCQIGDLYPMVPLNSVVGDVKGLGNIPIRSQGTRTIFIRDVGSVEDGADIQTGYALVNGRRTVYTSP